MNLSLSTQLSIVTHYDAPQPRCSPHTYTRYQAPNKPAFISQLALYQLLGRILETGCKIFPHNKRDIVDLTFDLQCMSWSNTSNQQGNNHEVS